MGRSKKKKTSAVSATTNRESQPLTLIRPDSIKGIDDAGNFYASHAELEHVQKLNKTAWYAANEKWWDDGGYGGSTDEEAMIGDEGGAKDGVEGLQFLDRLIAKRKAMGGASSFANAIDAGAGVGRVTKLILLRRYGSVHLIEADPTWSKRSRVYLGRKRANICTFTCGRLEELDFSTYSSPVDLIWLQWTLQYLTDVDAITTLRNLATALIANGVLVVKENRPYGAARSDRFQMDTPDCSGRYDITRSDAHHRLLFERAGLHVDVAEQGEETNTYAVKCTQGM